MTAESHLLKLTKVVRNKATETKWHLQAWWLLVNFTYNANADSAVAYVLTIGDATTEWIYPIISLALHQDGSLIHPMNHRQQAWQRNKGWQQVNVEACIPDLGWGLCVKGIPLESLIWVLIPQGESDISQYTPSKHAETVLVYVSNGCVHLWSWMPTNSNWSFEFDVTSSCSFGSVDFIVFIAYNHSVYQSWANNETNYVNPTRKTYAINRFCMCNGI